MDNNSIDSRITYNESPAYDVAHMLREKGYLISNSNGYKKSEPDRESVGIVKPIKVEKNLFGIKWESNANPLFLGVLWFSNGLNKANYQNWVFDVYGKKYVSEMKEVLYELSEQKDAKVRMELISEYPRNAHNF